MRQRLPIGPEIRSILIIVLFCMLTAANALAGTIDGTVSIQPEKDGKLPGDWVRLLLVTDFIDVPKVEDVSQLQPFERVDRINSAHSKFYVAYQKKLQSPDYLVASTLSTENGHFKFVDVAPGRYYIVVTLPTMIAGYKVCWQVPVVMPDSQATVHVDLDNDNLALPAARR